MVTDSFKQECSMYPIYHLTTNFMSPNIVCHSDDSVKIDFNDNGSISQDFFLCLDSIFKNIKYLPIKFFWFEETRVAWWKFLSLFTQFHDSFVSCKVQDRMWNNTDNFQFLSVN